MEKVAEATKVTEDLPHSNIFERRKKIRNLNIAVRAKNGKLINVYGNANERNLE